MSTEDNILIDLKNLDYYHKRSAAKTQRELDSVKYRLQSLEEIPNGKNGKSAYEIAVENGFDGSENEWLISLVGDPGEQGPQGIQGEKGDAGPQGIQGERGLPGEKGQDGVDGYTPIKGVDYFTENDKNELVNQVLQSLPVYNGEVE